MIYMKTFYVRVEGYCNCVMAVYEIKASCEEDAIAKAKERYLENLDFDFTDKEEYEASLDDEWEDEDEYESDDEEEETFNMTEDEVRADWETALEQVECGTDLSSVIGWAFSTNDITELAKLHKANKFREKIEDLLTDCNFHYECGQFANGEYDEFLKEEK